MSEDWPDEPIKMTDENFDEKLEKYPVVVVDCWADWCGPCKMVEPTIDELAEEMQGEVVFGKLNVDENKEKSNEYGISSIPTMLVFKDGEQVDSMIGAQPKEAMKGTINKHID